MNISPEIARLIDEIKGDKAHGASQLARQAVSIFKVTAGYSRAGDARQFLEEQKEIGQQLMEARPAMAPLFNMVSRLLSNITQKASGMDLAQLRQYTISKADEAAEDSLRAVAQIAEYGSELVAGGDRIMTHSYSSTVMAALKKAFLKHRDIELIITRSGAGASGEITAKELSGYGIQTTFIDDTAMGLYLPAVNKCFVGADRICADGKLINGIGSYLLAMAAEKNAIPFYVLCEMLKFDPRKSSTDVDLEEKEPSELVGRGRLPAVVKVKNPHFDITPLDLVTRIITEKGLLVPGKVITYMKKGK